MSSMNICMLSELFYPFMLGGAERRYYEIARRLAKNHNVTVYSLKFHGFENQETHEGIEIKRVGIAHPLNTRKLPPLATYLPAFFRSISGKYDIIDANQGISSFIGMLKPFVSEPIVATFHDIYWNQWNDYFPFPFSSVGKTMEFFWSKMNYTKIITVSPMTERKLNYLGFESPIEIVPSGVDSDFIDSIISEKNDLSVVFVGRLVKYKNIDSLIRAFSLVSKEYPKAKLKIVGSGPEEEVLKKLVKSLNIKAEFYGFVSEEEKIRIMKSSSILVNPSSVEGLGLILIEGMACGIPVIAKNLDTYFFCNKRNSVMYDSELELSEKMRQLLGDRQLRLRISKEGLKTSREFSWDNVAKNIERIYGDLT